MNQWLRLERVIRLILTSKWDRFTWPIAKNVLGIALRFDACWLAMDASTDRRRAFLTAALGFAEIQWRGYRPDAAGVLESTAPRSTRRISTSSIPK